MTKPLSDAIARQNWPQYNDLTSVYAFCDALVKRDTQIERLKLELKEAWRADRANAERLCEEVRKRDHAVSVLAELLAAAEGALAIAKAELNRVAPRTP